MLQKDMTDINVYITKANLGVISTLYKVSITHCNYTSNVVTVDTLHKVKLFNRSRIHPFKIHNSSLAWNKQIYKHKMEPTDIKYSFGDRHFTNAAEHILFKSSTQVKCMA